MKISMPLGLILKISHPRPDATASAVQWERKPNQNFLHFMRPKLREAHTHGSDEVEVPVAAVDALLYG